MEALELEAEVGTDANRRGAIDRTEVQTADAFRQVVSRGTAPPPGMPSRGQLASLIFGLQTTVGNRAAQRFVARQHANTQPNRAARGGAPSIGVQRRTDEDEGARADSATAATTTTPAPAAGAAPAPPPPPGTGAGPGTGATTSGTAPAAPATTTTGGTGPGAPPGGTAPGGAPGATGARPAAPTGTGSATLPPAPTTGASPDTSGAPNPVPNALTPTVAAPNSGVNWGAIWDSAGTGPNAVRAVLEISRLIPGWGALGGAVADGINWWQDIDNLSGVDAPWTVGVLHLRNFVSLANNFVGHLQYIDELATDLGAISVVGIEITPFTTAIHEILSSVKLTLDGAQVTLDFVLMCDAIYQRQTAPPGSPAFNAWNNMAGNYVVNFGSTVFTTYMDVMSASTGGVANTEVVKDAVNAGMHVMQTAKYFEKAVMGIIQGWIGVWGGAPAAGANTDQPPAATTLTPAAGPAPAPAGTAARLADAAIQRAPGDTGTGGVGGAVTDAARTMFFSVVLAELQQVRGAYDMGDTLINHAVSSIDESIAQARAVATELLGGQDPFVFARDNAHHALDYLASRIGDLTQMGAFATNAHEKATWITSEVDSLLASVNGLALPTITLPSADTGVGVLDDAANAVGSVAASGAQTLLNQLTPAVARAKTMAAEPLNGIKAHASEIGGFMQVVTDQAAQQITLIQAKITELSTQLAQCNNFEDVINMLVNQILQAAGVGGGRFEIDNIRQAWRALGPFIDEKIVWAQTNVVGPGGSVQRAVDEGGDVPEMGPAEPPPAKP